MSTGRFISKAASVFVLVNVFARRSACACVLMVLVTFLVIFIVSCGGLSVCEPKMPPCSPAGGGLGHCPIFLG